MELQCSLRVFIIENVITTHNWALWTSCETPGPGPTLLGRSPLFLGPPPPGLLPPGQPSSRPPPNHTPTYPNPPWWNTGGRTSWTQKVFFECRTRKGLFEWKSRVFSRWLPYVKSKQEWVIETLIELERIESEGRR